MLDQTIIDELRSKVIPDQHNFIDNQFVIDPAAKRLAVESPIDGKVFTSICDSSGEDVDSAVAAARAAFNCGDWSNAAPAYRKKILLKWAELIEQHAVEIAVLGVRDNGTDINTALKGEPLGAANTLRYYAEACDKLYGEIAPTSDAVLGLIHREPVGVVGLIIPWNFPLMIAAWKLGPALAAGNCVVLKPAESASLTLLKIAELAAQAGMPSGVLNVVTGLGSSCGEAIGLHMDIDVLAFTGSGPIGRRLLEYSARSNLKRIYLELGGKSPNIIFADAANLDRVARETAASIFRNSGQVCVAASRVIVENSIKEELTEKVLAYARTYRIGDPLLLSNNVGAIANSTQLQVITDKVQQGIDQGATLALGGKRILADSGGYYFAPTIFLDVQPSMSIATQEVFGPVLSIIGFDTMDEAIEIANSTEYGLSSVVWTANLATAHTMVKAIQAGVVQVNCFSGADITVPLGGVKQSGNGSDKSLHGFDKYINVKTAWISLDAN
ncbi:MAG: aldehyde dehydrogenase family protein [Pseudomonadales bacterium]|nr:aldehyde dehydrogenase family protein [Pseudomonadales bacterium]NRA14141.1 aldehyde dehydrogenase family protein [Oceanospirillaceae bacterium]